MFVTLQITQLNFWRSLATRVSLCAWKCDLVSEISSSLLSTSFRAATRCTQLETRFSARHVQRHAGGHYQRFRLRSSSSSGVLVEPIMACFENTSPDSHRVWNHRRCDTRRMHGSLCDHFNSIPLQCPRPLRGKLAKDPRTKTVDTLFWLVWNICIPMTMNDLMKYFCFQSGNTLLS